MSERPASRGRSFREPVGGPGGAGFGNAGRGYRFRSVDASAFPTPDATPGDRRPVTGPPVFASGHVPPHCWGRGRSEDRGDRLRAGTRHEGEPEEDVRGAQVAVLLLHEVAALVVD